MGAVARWLGVMGLLMLAGCNSAALVAKFTNPQEQAVAKRYFAALHDKRFDDIENAADASIAGPALHATLEQMSALIPAGEPTGVTLVGAHRNVQVGGAETVNLTYEYAYAGKWILTNLALKRENGKSSITGMSVVPQAMSIEEASRFGLAGKSPLQYLMLVLAICFPLLTLGVLVVCARTRLQGRKWPWIVFILCGFGNMAINWTTGAWSFQPLYIQLLSAAVQSTGFGPWTLQIAFPLGAFWFLARREQLRAPPATAPVPAL